MPRPPRRKVAKGSSRAGNSMQITRATRTKQPAAATTRPEAERNTKSQTLADAPNNKMQFVLASNPIEISGPETTNTLSEVNKRSTRTSSGKLAKNPQVQTGLTRTKGGRIAQQNAPVSTSRPISRRQSSNNNTTTSILAPQQRQRTPSRAPSVDSDLYGLSPGGEISRAKIEATTLSTSLNKSYTAPISRRPSFSRPGSVLRGVRATPGKDSSVLALNHFKRRARKPSIIRFTNTAQNSEVEDNNDLGDDLSLGLSSELGSDGFKPVGESTPLNVGKGRTSTAGVSSLLSSGARKRKFDETTAPEIVVVASSPPLSSPRTSSLSDENSLPERAATSGSEDVAFPTAGSVEAEPLSDTMAPPLSSESGEKTPSMTESQESAARKRIKLKQPTTEQLETLLPKMQRRRPVRAVRKDVYDLSDSPAENINREPEEDESDIIESIESEEEVASLRKNKRAAASRRQQATKSPAQRKTKRMKQSSVLAESRNKGNSRRGDIQSIEKSKSGVSPKKSSRRRTYGSRYNNIDKENDDDVSFQPELDEDTIIIQTTAREKILSAIRRKFEEVDEWEMDFEEVVGESENGWR